MRLHNTDILAARKRGSTVQRVKRVSEPTYQSLKERVGAPLSMSVRTDESGPRVPCLEGLKSDGLRAWLEKLRFRD